VLAASGAFIRSRRVVLAAAALVALGACAKNGTAASTTVGDPAAAGTVGYVHMDDLVKHHPLYSQLSAYDESIQSLDLRGTVPDLARPSAALAREEAALQKELDAAAARTRRLLDAKSHEFQAREQAAIAAALRGGAAGPSAAEIRRQIATTAQQQAVSVGAQAQRDYDRYRSTIIAEDGAELSAAQRALTDRANRTYRAKQDELQAREAALSLDLANRDAAQRLALRTRLSSLALDDADRDDARNKLAAIDRKESDELAALKNRDAQTLGVLQAQLRAGVQRDIESREVAIRARTGEKLKQRQDDIRQQFTGTSGLAAAGPAASNPKLTPQLRTKIKALHDAYQQQFENDARSTIADFQRTRDDLRHRYEELRGVDAASQGGAQAQIASLTKKRDDLYDQMVAQIGREVRIIAQQRGISVVVTDPVANPGGVDLTADAMKDIESLHE
jgi:hypothetical protein